MPFQRHSIATNVLGRYQEVRHAFVRHMFPKSNCEVFAAQNRFQAKRGRIKNLSGRQPTATDEMSCERTWRALDLRSSASGSKVNSSVAEISGDGIKRQRSINVYSSTRDYQTPSPRVTTKSKIAGAARNSKCVIAVCVG